VLRRFDLNPRNGIIVATVLMVVLGSARFLIDWNKVSLWRDLIAFFVFGVGVLGD